MEALKRSSPQESRIIVSTYKPSSYKEMDDWLNEFSVQEWTAVLGAYAAGGMINVIQYLRIKYPTNLQLWRDKDLRHYLNCRRLSDFRTKAERFSNKSDSK